MNKETLEDIKKEIGKLERRKYFSSSRNNTNGNLEVECLHNPKSLKIDYDDVISILDEYKEKEEYYLEKDLIQCIDCEEWIEKKDIYCKFCGGKQE